MSCMQIEIIIDKDSHQGIVKIILTIIVPPVSNLRNTGGFANTFTVDGIAFPAFLHLMQLSAFFTLDTHHWLDISSVVVGDYPRS